MLFFIGFFLMGVFLGGLLVNWRGKLLLKHVEKEKKFLEEKIVFFQQMHQEMGERFKGISLEAVRYNQETFFQLAQSSFEKFQTQATHEFEKKERVVHDLIKPVKESLEKFEVKVHELEKARIGAYVGLKEQVSAMMEGQKQLRQETSNLVKALRSPVVKGRWGEIQLKRVVELAGMLDHCDFFEQETVISEEKRFRPDLLVRLPGKKNIIIDAKVPLEAYLEGIESPDEESRRFKMQEHARQVRQHMLLLGKKSYWDQFQSSPEFVVLFLPGETFFSAALEQDPSLIEMGVDQQVILATPTTLIALLRAVAYGWRQERLSENAAQVSALGQDLYKRIVDMGAHWVKLGKSLGGAVDAYNKAVGSLETRVLVTARRFKDLNWVGVEKEIESIEQLESIPREIQAPEIETDKSI